MGNKPDGANPEDLIVLNDVRIFDIYTGRWLSHHGPELPSVIQPKARYAHLSSVSGDRLFIIGGQDINNVWLDDVYIFDLKAKQWVHRRDYQRHCGTYRSVAVAADLRVRMPQEELRGQPSTLGPPGKRFTKDDQKFNKEFTPSESLVHLPYSTKPTDEYPNDIYLYSNYNFTDVKRELEVFTPLPSTEADFAITDRSSSMTGSALPPGLRFPAGAILGTHLIIAGTYLAHTYQSFSIWALDLITNTWSRIDPGSTLSAGSWFRSCLWADANKFMIFGNRRGNLVEDYNRRLLSWDHVATVDLEAFGVYQPPKLALEVPMQELGLAALEEEVLADFEIICDDGRKIRCSRQVLEERWPWFKTQLKYFIQEATRISGTLSGASSGAIPPLPTLPGAPASSEPRHDPRLTPRSFQLSEPYPISLAFVQYFYTRALVTPLQHAPAVLSQLLVLASTYELQHLQDLVVHAMHRALSNSTSVGVYEVATLCSCRSLQIRALKTVMAYNQRRPAARSRRDMDGGGSGSGSGGAGRRALDRDDGPGGSGYGGGGRGDTASAARPRGMSDAYMRGGSTYVGASGGGGASTRAAGYEASGMTAAGQSSTWRL
jgi:leucine-zipper-like transcriptional regulator 1